MPVRDTPMLDPFTLRERAEALEPRARVDELTLHIEPGEVYSAWPEPKTDPTTGEAYELPYHELLLDPYTGERLGARKWGQVSLAKQDIPSFLYQLHMTLALPETMGSLGGYILGITALLWTLDCFIGFYLTLPPGRGKRDKHRLRHAGRDCRHPEHRDVTPPSPSMALDSVQSLYGMTEVRSPDGVQRNPGCASANPTPDFAQAASGLQRSRSFWNHWKPAWLIKKRRFNYDLHRASGFWVWPMLFVLAWSSVRLNLNEVYSPVMKTFFTLRNAAEERPEIGPPLESPALGWREAHALGQRLGEASARHGFTIEREEGLSLDRAHGIYGYKVKSSEGQSDWGGTGTYTYVLFDANTGALERLPMPATEASGDVVTRWLVW